MTNIENIVKTMNFHSLVRIDKAKKKAENFFEVEEHLISMMSQILDNKNLNIDKKIIKPNKNGVILDIYIGNDFGFCGNFNSLVSSERKKRKESKKIVIGKKIFAQDKSIVLQITKEDFFLDFSPIEEIINNYIKKDNLKEVNVIYNRYYHVGDIRFEKNTIFPIQKEITSKGSTEVDFVIETDIKEILKTMVTIYLCYELKILETYSWASENVMREQITRESQKKIEELNEEKKQEKRKKAKEEAFKKQISNYRMGG